MALAFVTPRLIDLAIFASLGGLWIAGALFIVVLYRWILRFERGSAAQGPQAHEPTPTRGARSPQRARPRPHLQGPAPVSAREALGQRA